MIQIVWDMDNYSVTIEGHAGSGEAGHDLVCAGVSTLAYTLAQRIGGLPECMSSRAILDPGYAEISCKPIPGREDVVQDAFGTICTGFEMLASDYPEYVTFDVVEG